VPTHSTLSPDSATPKYCTPIPLPNPIPGRIFQACVCNRITPRALPRGSRGFTLLDLIIVIIILGVLAMVIVPQIGSMANLSKINSAAWELISAFQYTQTLAIEHQRPFQIKVMTAADRNQFLIKDQGSYVIIGRR
jgi:prepilin-type N-terminal cleavage/methylation domain-containing protein